MNKKYKFGVYIGKFQGFHNAHYEIILNALKLVDKLIIVIGSANKAIDWKHPWSTNERIIMIERCFTDVELNNIHFVTVEDRLYQNNEWQALVYEAIGSVTKLYNENNPSIALVGCDKDASSWYVRNFPTFHQELTTVYTPDETQEPLSSTIIRDFIFNNQFGYAKNLMPENAYNYIKDWLKTDNFKYLNEWYQNDINYQKPYENLPYGSSFYCADSTVFQSGHVLLIKRKMQPGKNLWANPGGFIGIDETAFDASLRELNEETDIDVPRKVLIGCFVGEKIFDHPNRSLRGTANKKRVARTVSISHCYSLENQNFRNLPKIKANDDAQQAKWFNMSEVKKMREVMFEDHLDQILYWSAQIDSNKYR